MHNSDPLDQITDDMSDDDVIELIRQSRAQCKARYEAMCSEDEKFKTEVHIKGVVAKSLDKILRSWIKKEGVVDMEHTSHGMTYEIRANERYAGVNLKNDKTWYPYQVSTDGWIIERYEDIDWRKRKTISYEFFAYDENFFGNEYADMDEFLIKLALITG